MAKKEPDGYFTTYLNTIQEVPRLLQKFFSSILDSDIREIGPISSIASGLIEQSAKNNAKSAEDLLSTMLEVMNLYDGKLSEMTEVCLFSIICVPCSFGVTKSTQILSGLD